jgi:hypothetical protein
LSEDEDICCFNTPDDKGFSTKTDGDCSVVGTVDDGCLK